MILTHLAGMQFWSGIGSQASVILVPTRRYVLVVPASSGGLCRNMPPLIAGVPQTLAVDFGLFLPPGVTAENPSITISVTGGTDPSPQSRLDLPPQVSTVPKALAGTGLSDTSILFQVTILGGVNYLMLVEGGRSDGTDEMAYAFHISGITPA